MELISDYSKDTEWQTRDGKQTARHVGTFANGKEVFIIDNGSYEYVATRRPDGRRIPGYDSIDDIIPVPKKQKVWVNIYKNGGGIWMGPPHGTKESALQAASNATGIIACKEIEWFIGEGLE